MTTLKVSQPVTYSRVLGVGGVRGERVVMNDEIVGPINSSDEWIRQRTGIISRRRAEDDTSLLDMCEEAGRAAIVASGVDPASIDTVILATVTYMEQTPAAAAIVADRLGLTPAAAFDISAACAGYCYGIGQADALVRAGSATNVLVIGAEKMSDFIDPTDRSISFILGDGAGAAIVGPSETPGIGPTVWGTDGSQAHLIAQTHSWLTFRDGS
ncbi:MAG: 3-oxoacyl-ACP synthase, partial [Actinomycetota bacterium]